MRAAYLNLLQALDGLPPVTGRLDLLRVADVPFDYKDRIRPGDIVTNAPTFMSASSMNDYAGLAFAEGAAAPGGAGAEQPGAMLAAYLIKSQAGGVRPLLPGATTQAADEQDGSFPPDTWVCVDS